ncbi:MAG: MBL fold metallo-hydrolase [Thermoguttaceae bacterium]
MSQSAIHILSALSSICEESSYIVYTANHGDCVVIDPGIDTYELVEKLEQHRLRPIALLITHGHYDHIGGIDVLREKWPGCSIMTSPKEADKLVNPALNLSEFFGYPKRTAPADRLLQSGEVLELAGITFEVFEIPGHSAGHLAFLIKSVSPYLMFVGDIIFSGSVGRSDFNDGDSFQLISGIREKILTLPDDTLLYPGHGPKTTVGREKQFNPFLR